MKVKIAYKKSSYVFIPNKVNNLISKYYSFSSECYNFITHFDNMLKSFG
jgi:hypothetical protein